MPPATQPASSFGAGAQVGEITESQRPLRPNSYRLTHPKNYVGVPLAIAADAPTEVLIDEYLVSMPGAAKVGARALGYLTVEDVPTPIGRELITTGAQCHGSVEAALQWFDTDSCRFGRFGGAAPEFAKTARRALNGHPGATAILAVLRDLGRLTLPELAVALSERAPEVCSRLLISDEDPVVDAVSTSTLEEPADSLTSVDVYRPETTYQFKSILCHLGVLETPGSDSSTLTPATDTWAITKPGREVLL